MQVLRHIATGLKADAPGPGVATFELYNDLWSEFVKGEPCTECVNAQYPKDRHSLCELMIDERRK